MAELDPTRAATPSAHSGQMHEPVNTHPTSQLAAPPGQLAAHVAPLEYLVPFEQIHTFGQVANGTASPSSTVGI